MNDAEFYWNRALELASANQMEDAIEAVRLRMAEQPEWFEVQASALCERQALAFHSVNQNADAIAWANRAIDLLYQFGSSASSASEGLAAQARIDELKAKLKMVFETHA